MATAKKEVAVVKENTAIVVQATVPDYIKFGENRGSEQVTTDDLVIPRLEIVQGLSPAVKRGDPGFIAGAMPGMFNNSVSRQLYGEEVIVIPVYFSMQFLVWRDRKLAEQLKIKAEGGFFGSYHTQHEAQARADEEGGEAAAVTVIDTPTHLCLVINPDTYQADEIMIPMPRTKAKVSRQWNSLIKMAGGDRFSRAYKMTADLQKNDKGDFYNFKVEPAGFPSEDIYALAEGLYQSIAAGQRRSMDLSDVEESSAPQQAGDTEEM